MQADSLQHSSQQTKRATSNHSALTYVLLNPHSHGGRSAQLVTPLKKLLAKNGLHDALLITPTAQAALQMVHALPACSRVIIAGGDGTVHHLLPALVAGGHTLCVLPLGSGNDSARAMGTYKLTLANALSAALHHPSTQIDVGEIHTHEVTSGETHERLFVSSFSAGFDASISLRAREGPTWLSGMPRYLWATLGELRALRHWPMQVAVEDQVIHDGPTLFASSLNTPSFGGGMPAVPHASIQDGALDLLMAGEIHMTEVLQLLPRLLIGKHLGRPKVHTQTFTKLSILSPTPIPIAADGEYIGQANEIKIYNRNQTLAAICL